MSRRRKEVRVRASGEDHFWPVVMWFAVFALLALAMTG